MKVGLAGFGFAIRHAQVIAANPFVTEFAIAELNADRRQQAAQEHPRARIFNEAVEMLHDMEPDCLIVASSSDSHAAITRAALEAGIHVFSEKPLALSWAEARDLKSLADQAGLIFQAGYILRYEARHQLLHDHVNSGRLGRVVLIRSKRNCSRTWFETWGKHSHPVLESMVHDIDLATWLTKQRCVRVSAWGQKLLGGPPPEAVVAVLEFDGGALAVLETSWLIPDGAPANIVGPLGREDEGAGVLDAHFEVHGTSAVETLSLYDPSLMLMTDERTYVPGVHAVSRPRHWEWAERSATNSSTSWPMSGATPTRASLRSRTRCMSRRSWKRSIAPRSRERRRPSRTETEDRGTDAGRVLGLPLGHRR